MSGRKIGPMDYITGMAGVTIAGWAIACTRGHALTATAILGSAFGLAYINAPSRSYPTGEEVTEGVDLTGKVAVVTGATSGIGVETARVLALRGAHVYIAGRNPSKLEATQKKLIAELPSESNKIDIVTCDLGDLQSVKHCAKTVLASNDKLDLLINNAGIMALPTRTDTNQGLESQVGVCHVGHFYLTNLLLPAVQKANGRVVCLSSSAHYMHDMKKCLESPKLETDPYREWTAYGNAKACNMLHAKTLSTKPHVTAYSVMPGGIHTGLQDHVDWYTMLKWYVVTPFYFKSIPQGAATTLLCATSNDTQKIANGDYHDNCKSKPEALEKVLDVVGKDAPDRLWEISEKLLKDLGFD